MSNAPLSWLSGHVTAGQCHEWPSMVNMPENF
jgi:hypothetical protein